MGKQQGLVPTSFPEDHILVHFPQPPNLHDILVCVLPAFLVCLVVCLLRDSLLRCLKKFLRKSDWFDFKKAFSLHPAALLHCSRWGSGSLLTDGFPACFPLARHISFPGRPRAFWLCRI